MQADRSADALAAHLARGLVRAMGTEPAPPPVLLLAPDHDPLGEYLRRGILDLGTPVTRAPEEVSLCRGVAVTRLTPRLVCRVWSGGCPDGESEAVFQSLLTKKPVWTPREGRPWEALPPGPLLLRVRERFWELRRAGLEVLPAEELIRRAAGAEQKERRG